MLVFLNTQQMIQRGTIETREAPCGIRPARSSARAPTGEGRCILRAPCTSSNHDDRAVVPWRQDLTAVVAWPIFKSLFRRLRPPWRPISWI
jgi:hypothetical protein